MKRLSYLLAALLLLLGLLLTLPFSAAGTRLLLHMVEATGVVQLQHRSGSLFGELRLDWLQFETGALELRLEQLESKLDMNCFWASTFCFETLNAGALELEISASGDEGEASVDDTPLVIPYAWDIPALRIQQLVVSWPGGSWQQQGVRAGLRMAESNVDIASLESASAVLRLEPDEDTADGYQGFKPPRVYLPFELSLRQSLLAKLQLTVGGSTYSAASLAVAAVWQGETLRLGELFAQSDALGSLNASGLVLLDENWPLQLQAQVQFDQGMQPSQLGGRSVQLGLDGDLQDLQLTIDSPGEPELNLQAMADATAAGLPLQGSASLSWPSGSELGNILQLNTGLPRAQLLEPVHVAFRGNLQAQTLQLTTRLQSPDFAALDLSARAQWQAPLLQLESLTVHDEATDSRLEATARINLGAMWSVDANLVSDGFYVPPLLARESGRIRGSVHAQASGDEQGWRLQVPAVDLQGTVNGLPATVAGFAGVTSSLQLLPGELDADINGAQLSLQAGSEASADATFNLQVDDLGRWLAGARGQLDLRGEMSKRRQLAVRGGGSDLNFAGIEIPAADLRLAYGLSQGQIDLALTAPAIRQGEYRLEDVQLTLEGSAKQHQLQLATGGRIEGQLQIEGQSDDGVWHGVLQPTELATSAGPWTLAEQVPLQWSVERGALEIAAHCWQHSQFTLCTADMLAGRQGDLNLRLQGDVNAFNGFLPPGLKAQGALQSRLQLAWDASGVTTLEGTARVTELEIERLFGMGERVSIAWDSIDLAASREGAALAITAQVVRQGRRVLDVDALLPGTAQQSISGNVTLDTLQLVTFAPWVTELSTLKGSVSGKLALGGTPAEPRASGELVLQDGHLVVVGNPTELTALNLSLQLDGDSGRLDGEGLLGGGPLRFRGKLLAQPQLSLELAISGERHQILLPPASEMLVSEELSLLLTNDLLDVGGDVHVHEGVLRHEELPEGSVAVSRDVVEVDLRGNVISEQRLFDVRADILLNLDERFRVEGEGLTATLGGELQLRQEPGKSLQVFGNLNLQGGELFVFRQHLQVRRGTIAFSGPPDNPELNISAERSIRAEGITVGARVSGALEQPELEVYSDPVMSQGEAMSYLARGRGLDAGAGGDGTALALSLGADIVNRSGIVEGLNRLPLISNIAFGASGDEDDTAATVSGYIGNRIYVSYGIGIYEPINVLTARLYLQSRLWLEVVSRLENSMDIYYSFDIR